MKRLLAAAALAGALLGGACATAHAQSFGIGLNLDLTAFRSRGSPASPGACSSCYGGCLPPPGWSPDYPQPTMYGGLFASMPRPGAYPPPYPAFGYPPFAGAYGGYGPGFGWAPAQAPVPATPGISTVPPPEPGSVPAARPVR